MRAFVALELAPQARDYLVGVMKHLREILGKAKYTFPDHLHLTLAFMENISNAELSALAHSLVSLEQYGAFCARKYRIDCFERARDQLFFLRFLDEQKKLSALHLSVCEILDGIGIGYDHKAFIPHITLARDVHIDLARQTAKSLRFDPYAFVFSTVSLIESRHTAGAVHYCTHARICLHALS